MANSPHSSVCVISGGSSGVGLATALKFAGSGSPVAVCGRQADRLEAARQQIAAIADDDQVLTVVADLSRPAGAEHFINAAVERFSRIDLLVNNAAVAPLAPLDEMTDEVIDGCIDLNIRGTCYATRAAWRRMKQQGSGIVVNISSQAAVDPFPGFSLYGSTKAWIELFTIALAGEGRQHGIRCYGIRPGAIDTPMLRKLFPDFPAEQCVTPAEVADAIAAVCGPGMAHSSGQIIKVSRQ
jgi:3-oxoacyl-[acyl-carrier protein] reductase